MNRPWQQRLFLRSLHGDLVGNLAMLAALALSLLRPTAMRRHFEDATHEYLPPED